MLLFCRKKLGASIHNHHISSSSSNSGHFAVGSGILLWRKELSEVYLKTFQLYNQGLHNN